jgi:hypothetical protein
MALKTVLYPVKVPDGKYCWEWTGEHWICPQFDNEGGTPSCPFLRIWRLKQTEDGVLKPQECIDLIPLSAIR